MILSDKLQKFIFESCPVKGSIVHLHSSWQEVCAHAQPPQKHIELFAETVCSSVLLTSNIKFEGSVSLQIQAAGELGLVLGQCTHNREIRGVVRLRPDGDSSSARTPVLSINLEPADGGQSYQGIVAFPGGSVAEALEAYFSKSEQLDTRVWLAVGQQSCSGLMLQRLPGQHIESDDWNRLTALASTVKDEELLALDADSLLRKLFFEETVRLFEPESVRFGCQCSKERVGVMLRNLGENEVLSILEEQGSVEVCCEYCGQKYKFDHVDAAQLFIADGQIVIASDGHQ